MSEDKFCKNCGKQISDDFKLCPYCGEKVEEKILEIPCPSCGKTIKNDFKVCPYCGNNPNNEYIENYNNYDTKKGNYTVENYYYELSSKSGTITLLLLIFLGFLGAHRFYAGRIASGIIFLVLGIMTTCFSMFIENLSDDEIIILIIPVIIYALWWLIDLVSIAKGNFKDSQGRYIKMKR